MKNKIFVKWGKLIFVMTFTSKNDKVFIFVKIIYETVAMSYTSAPSLAKFQRFGLPESLGQTISLNIFNEQVNLFYGGFVEVLPFRILFPGERGKYNVHWLYSPNSSMFLTTTPPFEICCMDLSSIARYFELAACF